MKKIFLALSAIAVFFVACQEEPQIVQPNDEVIVDMSDFVACPDGVLSDLKSAQDQNHVACGTMLKLREQLDKNPGLEKELYKVEKHTRQLIAYKGKPGGGGSNGGGGGTTPYTGTITIPVIVNILEDPNHPVTTAHINSQIAILNEDYNDNNSNTNGVPSEFASLVANCDITFVLAGVNRKASTKSSWGTNDAMKQSSQGGIDPTDPAHYLNFWVCEIGGGILGYAQFPGGSPSTDGVVIGSDFFGENAAGGQYGHGRTATHEVGHWLNLRHIWGDGRCRQDDYVSDTPSSDRANYGCPVYPTVHCKSNDMTMNYMDYVDDDCMYMFTSGQNDRMRALFAAGGARETFVN